MALPNTLNTNEIKNAAGVEIEFSRLGGGNTERSVEFGATVEQPSYPHRLNIKHAEAGSGLNLRRRSVARFDVTNVGGIDTTKTKTTSAYLVLDIPIGNSANYDDAKLVMANLLSFCATTGAATTVLFDGTGHGAASLLAGSL